jgi:hypothetical protein
MPINWEEFDNNIKNIKYPHVFIQKFFLSLESLDDKYASVILRYIIKNNINIFVNNPFYVCIKHISKKKYPETIDILNTFYELIKQKMHSDGEEMTETQAPDPKAVEDIY